MTKRSVIPTESQAEFDLHRDKLLTELCPVGPMQAIFATRIVDLTWRLRRAKLVTMAAINAMNTEILTEYGAGSYKSKLERANELTAPDEPPLSQKEYNLGRIIIRDFRHSRVLDRLLMYERRIENSLHKTTTEFERLQLARQMNCSNPSEEKTLDLERLSCKTNPILEIHN